jgi:hypothetical protein
VHSCDFDRKVISGNHNKKELKELSGFVGLSEADINTIIVGKSVLQDFKKAYGKKTDTSREKVKYFLNT